MYGYILISPVVHQYLFSLPLIKEMLLFSLVYEHLISTTFLIFQAARYDHMTKHHQDGSRNRGCPLGYALNLKKKKKSEHNLPCPCWGLMMNTKATTLDPQMKTICCECKSHLNSPWQHPFWTTKWERTQTISFLGHCIFCSLCYSCLDNSLIGGPRVDRRQHIQGNENNSEAGKRRAQDKVV